MLLTPLQGPEPPPLQALLTSLQGPKVPTGATALSAGPRTPLLPQSPEASSPCSGALAPAERAVAPVGGLQARWEGSPCSVWGLCPGGAGDPLLLSRHSIQLPHTHRPPTIPYTYPHTDPHHSTPSHIPTCIFLRCQKPLFTTTCPRMPFIEASLSYTFLYHCHCCSACHTTQSVVSEWKFQDAREGGKGQQRTGE